MYNIYITLIEFIETLVFFHLKNETQPNFRTLNWNSSK